MGQLDAGSRWFDTPRPLAEVAAEVRALLLEAGVQLALAEAGDGEIARLLAAEAGPAVLTHARLFATPEELAAAHRVSPAKVAAFGALSAMVAAEAAADLIDTYEGGWGLVVMAAPGAPGSWGNQAGGPGVQKADEQPACFIALGTPSTTIIEQCDRKYLAHTVLSLLGQQARRRMQHR